MFEFSGGALSVTPSSSDTQISFEIFNVGDESGTAEVGCEVDGSYITSWSGTLSPNVGDRLEREFEELRQKREQVKALFGVAAESRVADQSMAEA